MKKKSKNKAVVMPEAYIADKLKRKKFAHDADVHIHGNVEIKEQLVIGGDCLVDGDLIAEEVFCLGKLTVTGSIDVQSLYVGHAVDVAGDLSVKYLLKTACSPEWMARLLEIPVPAVEEKWLDKLVHPSIRARREENDPTYGLGDIQCLGELRCGDLDAEGDVLVDGSFDAEEITYLGGHLSVASLTVQGDANCQSDVYVEGHVDVGAALYCEKILALGDISAKRIGAQSDIRAKGRILVKGECTSLHGEIEAGLWIGSSGNLYAAGHIKSGGSVVSEKNIHCGSDYGIFAGLNFSRPEWEKNAFISGECEKKNVLSGFLTSGKKLKSLLEIEKKKSKIIED